MSTLRFYKRKTKVSFVELPGVYEFRPDKKYHWIQKLALWVLEKLECRYEDEQYTIEYFEVNTRKFRQRIMDQHNEIMQRYLHPDTPCRVVIGSKDYFEMMGEVRNDDPFEFRTEFNYQDGPYKTVMGLTVQVVPWFEGIAVIPEKIQ